MYIRNAKKNTRLPACESREFLFKNKINHRDMFGNTNGKAKELNNTEERGIN